MNNYFCVLPFFSYENDIGSLKNIYCCRLAKNTNIENVRNHIRNQQRSPDCNSCWKLEDQGLPSERQLHNQIFDYYADRELELVEQDALAQGFSAKLIKLTTSTLCNSTCVTCGSSLSTAWAKLENRIFKYEVSGLPDIDWKNIIHLSFVGGEPLLEKKNFVILENLIDLGNVNCFVSIVTNGSIELSPHQLAVLSKFKNLNICLSIDGVGTKFEYIRFPLKWSQLEKNLVQFKKIAAHVGVSCTISNLNIFDYSELIDFFQAHQLEYLCKQVNSPEYFSPANVTEDFKQQIIEKNKKYQDEVQAFLNCGTPMLEKFWAEIDRQDRLKNINIKDYLPELAATRI